MAGRAVFVSYSQPDRETALALVARVEEQGVECWVAPRDVAPAADWAAEIVDAIAAARVMVLVFSASANASPQVRREVERAVHRRVAVLAFRVEDVLPSRSLEYFLSSSPTPAAPIPDRTSASGQQPSAATLQRLEAELARYIGPVARLLVNRAATRTSGLEALIRDLATEIESEADRRDFMRASEQSLRTPP